jgi:hypothetical protein
MTLDSPAKLTADLTDLADRSTAADALLLRHAIEVIGDQHQALEALARLVEAAAPDHGPRATELLELRAALAFIADSNLSTAFDLKQAARKALQEPT